MRNDYAHIMENYYRMAEAGRSRSLIFAGDKDALAFAVYVEDEHGCRSRIRTTVQNAILGSTYVVTIL